MGHEHDVNSEPMSIERCREILSDEANELSDDDVDQMRRHADAMAHAIIEIYLEQRTTRE